MFPRLFEIPPIPLGPWQLGPFSFYSFGLAVVVGFALAAWLAARLARERGLPGEALLDSAVIILLASLGGARLLFVVLNWEEYSGRPLDLAATWRGGMSFHGGVVAGVLAGVWAVRRRKLPVAAMADAVAPALALGYAVGRLGCLLNGCCYGGPTSLPWGLPAEYCRGAAEGAHYHPAQLYATFANLLLCGALIAYYRRAHRQGQVMAAYVIGYSAYRFLIEALRSGTTAETIPWAFHLTQAQLFSLISLAAGLAWHASLRRAQPAPEVPPPASAPPSPPPSTEPAGDRSS